MIMSYCKYELTVEGLEQCLDEWDKDDEKYMSREEKWAKEKMKIIVMKLATKITEEMVLGSDEE